MSEKVMNRGLVVVGAILIQLCLGAIYAWSVFTTPLTQAGWSKAETQYVFAAGLATFAVVMVLAGRMMPKHGPRKLAMAGGIVLGVGYALAGLVGATQFWPVFLGVGIIGGAGIGLAYVVPIAVGMRWFPDKKGLITGLAVAGFGFGAMLWVKLAGEWGHLIANQGLGTTFIVYGIVFLAAVVVGGFWMVFPPAGWVPAGYVAPTQAKAGGKHVAGTVDFASSQMLATPQFYMILLTFAFGASAGLMSIGLMKLWPIKALTDSGFTDAEAAAAGGTAMAVFFSLANGIGRIVWGMLSDKLGRKASIVIMMATQGLLVITFQWTAGMVTGGQPILLFVWATLIGFNFGGNFALFPTITADTFGAKFVGQNYGWVFLAYGIGGIFGPILGGKLGDMGNFPLAFSVCGVLCLLAAGIIAAVKPAKKKDIQTA
jgi:OFA family oxalate/formate antiporter-like MFS transporter